MSRLCGHASQDGSGGLAYLREFVCETTEFEWIRTCLSLLGNHPVVNILNVQRPNIRSSRRFRGRMRVLRGAQERSDEHPAGAAAIPARQRGGPAGTRNAGA